MEENLSGWDKFKYRVKAKVWRWLGIDQLWRRVELSMMGVEQIEKDLSHHIDLHNRGHLGSGSTAAFPSPRLGQNQDGN